MEVVVLATETQKEELLATGTVPGITVRFVTDVEHFLQFPEAHIFMDLLFKRDEHRIKLLKSFLGIILINSVDVTLQELNLPFVRINAWPTFLGGGIVEASSIDKENKAETEAVFRHFQKNIEWLPDEPGFITARVVSTIINEAYFALSEGISTKEEIDTAMKLGTNYPYGPFEWSKKIGLKNIVDLLTKLSGTEKRYTPCELMLREEGKIRDSEPGVGSREH